MSQLNLTIIERIKMINLHTFKMILRGILKEKPLIGFYLIFFHIVKLNFVL